MLRYVCHELLGNYLSLLVVPRRFRYELDSLAGFRTCADITDTVMGILLVYYQISQPICSIWRSTTINVGVPYSISVSLDVLLTLMIIVRLVLLSREVRNAMNAPFRISRLYKVVITILSESSALYAVTFLLWIGTWAADNSVQFVFFLLLAQTQVRGVLSVPCTPQPRNV